MIEINKIYNTDCVKGMSQIEDRSIDFVISDLPYGMIGCHWDAIIPFDKLWAQYLRVGKENCCYCLFGVQPFTTDLINSNRKMFKYSLVWNKNVPTGMAQAKYRPMRYHEDILIFYEKQPTYNPILKERVGVGKECYNYNHYCADNNHIQLNKVKKKYDPDFVQPSTVLDFKVVPNRNSKLHPTQKPEELINYLIRTYSNEKDLVLDSCMGSGTTAVAAKNSNRNFIGFENDTNYYKIACERIGQ